MHIVVILIKRVHRNNVFSFTTVMMNWWCSHCWRYW